MHSEDEKQLDLLAVFHYVFGGLLALFSCVPLIHVTIGLAIVSGKLPMSEGPQPFPSMFGWIFVIMGSFFIVAGWITAVCVLVAGRKLQTRRNRLFCMVVAGLLCAFMPLGTVLGVFTLIALSKEPVRGLFENAARERW